MINDIIIFLHLGLIQTKASDYSHNLLRWISQEHDFQTLENSRVMYCFSSRNRHLAVAGTT